MPTYGWNGTVDAGFAACARLPRRTLQRAVEKNTTHALFLRTREVTKSTKVKRAPRREARAQRLSVATHTRAAPRSTTKA